MEQSIPEIQDNSSADHEEDQPHSEDGLENAGTTSGNFLAECLGTVVRHRRAILLMTCAGLLAGLLVQLPLLPIYRANTSVDIQSANAGSFAEPASGNASPEVQMNRMHSDQTLARVQERMIDEPNFPAVVRGAWLSRLQRTLHLGGTDAIPLSDLLSQSARRLKVQRLGNTQLVGVWCDSWDPAFAARYCNMLTAEFQSEVVESRGALAKQTSERLMHEAVGIQAKSQDAQRRLKEALAKGGTVHQGGTSVEQQQLRQLQTELVKAQADRMAKQAEMEAATTTTDTDPALGPGDKAAYSASQARLQSKIADLQRRSAVMAAHGGSDAKVLHLRAQRKQLEAEMSKQHSAQIERLQAQVDAQKHREDLLALSYRGLQARRPELFQKTALVDQLRGEVAGDDQLYQALLQRAREAGFNSAVQTPMVRVLQEAKQPQAAIYPRRLRIAAAGLAFGGLMGVAMAFFKDRNRAVLRMPGESEQILGVDELGVIPSPVPSPVSSSLPSPMPTSVKDALLAPLRRTRAILHGQGHRHSAALQTARWDDDFSLVADAYRNTMLSLMLTSPEKTGRVYAVSSPSAGEGKSTVTSNLGVALSKSRLRVILIDGDLRRPSLHRTLSVPNGLGLWDLLRSEDTLGQRGSSLYCKATVFPNLCVIPAGGGKGQGLELLHILRFRELIRQLAGEFDVILVDTPPLLHMADARMLARETDGAIIVVRAGSTTRGDAMRARDLLARDQVPILGTILNHFNPAKEGKYGYYKSYHAYQNQE